MRLKIPAPQTDASASLTCFPVVGILFGLLLTLIGKFILITATPLVASFLGAVLITLLYWWVNGGKGISGVAQLSELFADDEAEDCGRYWGATVFQAFILIKAFCIGRLLFTNDLIWLPASLALGKASAAYVLESAGKKTSSIPGYWICAVAAACICGILVNPVFTGVFAAAFTVLLTPLLKDKLIKQFQTLDERVLHTVAELAEVTALIIGVLMISMK